MLAGVELDSILDRRLGRVSLLVLIAIPAFAGGCSGSGDRAGIGVDVGSMESGAQPILRSGEVLPYTDIEFEMVYIPEGGFWIGKTEVTWDEFLVYCAFDHDPPEGRDAISRPSKPLEVAPVDRNWGYGRRPAVGMSWNNAQKYCEWLSLVTGDTYRLPTEEEWRLACGDVEGSVEDQAWMASNSGQKTREVGLGVPNALGVHDMLGNLWEYCANPYDPAQPLRAVLRGGSWKDGAEMVTPDARLRFDNRWTLKDPAFPPGVWWVPDGDHLGMRVLREGTR